jgi:hypothetical protein
MFPRYSRSGSDIQVQGRRDGFQHKRRLGLVENQGPGPHAILGHPRLFCRGLARVLVAAGVFARNVQLPSVACFLEFALLAVEETGFRLPVISKIQKRVVGFGVFLQTVTEEDRVVAWLPGVD